jgi:mono/diheme cytochrome c family protein
MTPLPSRRRRSKKPGYIGLGILAAIVLIGAGSYIRGRLEQSAAHNMTNPVPATPATVVAAKPIYNSKCASCHGSNGDGKGDKAQNLWKSPTDFRNAARMNRRSDGDLYWITTKGSWPMPAFENKLTVLERWQLVDYIRTFASK